MVAATRLEAWAARRRLPRDRVFRVGVALSGAAPPKGALLVCGLAGALDPALGPGTVAVPEEVGLPSGWSAPCDPGLRQALLAAAADLGLEPVGGRLLTAPRVVTGPERARWHALGFDLVDMETGLLLRDRAAVATVRVVLDAPGFEISACWGQPKGALLDPRAWPQLGRLARRAPVGALLAAQVAAGALRLLEADRSRGHPA